MLRQILIDDRHVRSAAIIVLLKVTALKKGDIHRLKVPGEHYAIGPVWLLAPFWGWPSFNEERNAPHIACEWKMINCSSGGDARQCADSIESLLVKSRAIGVGVLGACDGNHHREQVMRIESRIDRLQRSEGANHQPRSRKQDYSEGKLRCDQKPADGATMSAFTHTMCAFLQRLHQVHCRTLKGRGQAKSNAGENGNHECEHKYAAVELDRSKMGNFRWRGCEQHTHPPNCHQHSQCASSQRQHSAFGEELAHDPRPAGSQ